MPRINFLFVLIILLTACTPNATLAPVPAVASSPVVIETPTIILPTPTAALRVPPFNSKDMEALIASGYKWDQEVGKLINPFGKEIELPAEAAETVEVMVTTVLDYEGRPFIALIKTEDGARKVSLPGGEWEPIMDLSAGRALVDANALANELSFYNWGTYEFITLDAIPVVPRESVESGLLRASRAINARPIPPDAPTPDWTYLPINSQAGIWAFTQYRTNSLELENYAGPATFPGKKPIVWETDGMVPSDIVQYTDVDGKIVINTGYQLNYNGDVLIYPAEFTDDYADPNAASGNFLKPKCFQVIQHGKLCYL